MSNPEQPLDVEESGTFFEIPTEVIEANQSEIQTEEVSVHTQGVCSLHRGKHYMRDGSCPICDGRVNL